MNAERGVTLIEVLVALTIATLLAAAAVPALGRALDRARASGSSRELVAALKTARIEARSTGHDALFRLDVESHVYNVAGHDRVLRTPHGATLTLLTAESERLGTTSGAIRFFPDGSSTGGTVTLEYRGREQHVEVDWLTGHVRAAAP